MTNLILLTNVGPGVIILGEEFAGTKPLALLRPGQSTIIRLGTTIRSEGPEILNIKAQELES